MSTNDRSRSLLAVGMGAVLFVALIIAGFGLLTLFGGSEPIEHPGLGPIPGIIAIAAATATWLFFVWRTATRRAGLWSATVAGVAAAFGHAIMLFIATIPQGIAVSLAVTGHVLTAGFSLLIAVAGILAATGVAVTVRYDGSAPRWRWENHDEDE